MAGPVWTIVAIRRTKPVHRANRRSRNMLKSQQIEKLARFLLQGG